MTDIMRFTSKGFSGRISTKGRQYEGTWRTLWGNGSVILSSFEDAYNHMLPLVPPDAIISVGDYQYYLGLGLSPSDMIWFTETFAVKSPTNSVKHDL